MTAIYFEEDYRPVAAAGGSGRFLPGTSIELIRELGRRQPPRHVLFDFDGTLSLIREGWVEIMVPLMVETLTATGTGESQQSLTNLAREFVMELTGKQTIYQMIRLAEEVRKRGGTPKEPVEYKQTYHDRLMERIAGRREALRSGRASPDEMLVPGSIKLLDALQDRGVELYVASGTDEAYVIEEVRLLGLDRYFGPHVYGAQDDVKAFSKAMVIARILKENRVPGEQLLGFGDGYVEIQNIRAVDGIAVAVASDEAGRSGKPDAWKRERLIGAGADIVIPDYQECQTLLDHLWKGDCPNFCVSKNGTVPFRTPYPAIDPRRLRVFPLSQRRNLLRLTDELGKTLAAERPSDLVGDQINLLAERILAARKRNAAVMLTYGAHLIKNGAGPLLNLLIEAGLVTHMATQGAGIIHDWEFALQGESGESVRENAPAGTFGSWDETGRWLNLAILAGAAEGLGLGESVGRLIAEDQLTLPTPEQLRQQIAADPGHPLAAAKADLLWTIETHHIATGTLRIEHRHKSCSVPGAAYQHRVPFTVHPGIGYDIIINHPLYHGGAIGRAATTDVRVYTASVGQLDGGVYMSVGSAIMSPQVFEKAFSAVNNLRKTEHRPLLTDHYLAIVDLQDGGGWDWSRGEPPSTNPAYDLRFCKSFYRMGGTLDYLRCDNRVFLVELLRRLGIDPSRAKT